MKTLEPEVVDELKGLVKEVCADSIKASAEQNAKNLEAWKEEFSKKSVEEQNALKARIEAIEKTPMVKRSIAIPGADRKGELIYGYKAEMQFRDIFKGQRCGYARELVVNPKLFPIISDDEKRAEMAKHLLMCLKASAGDPKAVMDYQDWRAKADLAEGTGSTGGFLVPDEFADEIYMFASLQSVGLRDARIWPMGSDVRRVPAENARVSVAVVAEATASGASDPTWNEVVLTAKKLTAYTTASNELLEDNIVDVVSYLTEIFAEAVGQEIDNQIFNGTGSPVSGLLTAAAGFSVVMSTGLTNFSSISGDNLVDMIDKIPQQAELGAKFYFNKNILTYIRKLKDTQNQYLFSPIAGGLPTDIWSYPYERVPKMPGTSASGTGKGFVLFGNLKYFALGRRRDSMSLMVDPYGKFLEGQTRFKIEPRWAWGIGLANAFCRLVTA